MCSCPTIGLKIGLIIVIIFSGVANAGEIVVNIGIICEYSGQNPLIFICLIISCFIMVALVFGVYATMREKFFLLELFLIFLVAYCVIKMFVWIVSGNMLESNKRGVTHLWFQLSMGTTLCCMIGTILLCMRVHDDQEEEILPN